MLLKTQSALMHAYVLSRSGLSALATSDFCAYSHHAGQEVGVDVWAMRHLKQYACYPQFAVQAPSPTSNFLKRDNALFQRVADWFFPAAVDFHRRHTFLVETTSVFIIPLLVFILAAILLVATLTRLISPPSSSPFPLLNPANTHTN